MASLLDFIDELLGKLGAPASANNQYVLEAFAKSEGTGLTYNNPFDTTLQEAGAPGINSVGVRDYATLDQGVQATADTFLGGSNYTQLVADLRSNAAPSAYLSGSAAQELQLWQGGSHIAETVISGDLNNPGSLTSWATSTTRNESASLSGSAPASGTLASDSSGSSSSGGGSSSSVDPWTVFENMVTPFGTILNPHLPGSSGGSGGGSDPFGLGALFANVLVAPFAAVFIAMSRGLVAVTHNLGEWARANAVPLAAAVAVLLVVMS